jgi:NTE family protein
MIAVVYRSDVEHLMRELAAQIARFSGKRVLIVDGPRAGERGLSATGGDEPDLSALLREPSRLDGLRGEVCMIDGRVPPAANADAIAAAFVRLRRAFPYVLACVPADTCELAAHQLAPLTAVVGVTTTPAIELVAAASRALGGACTRAAPSTTTLVVTDAPARPTRGELQRLAARAPGAAVVSSSQLAVLARTLTGTRVGVALGCGGARGFAHIGVLERLAERGVPVDVLAGTSAGAGIASLWALGQSPDRIAARFSELARHAVRPALPTRSLLSGRALLRHLERCVDGRGFEDMSMPVGVVAVDLDTGDDVVLTRGSLPHAVLASCAIPGLYPAVELGGRMLVDGGLLEPVPSRATAALGADLVIAVDLSRQEPRPRRSSPSIIDTVIRAADILHGHLAARTALAVPNAIHIAPRGERISVVGYARAASYRALGRDAVDAAWPELASRMPWLAAARRSPSEIRTQRAARAV